jgi:leucyl-tRNA synthetase
MDYLTIRSFARENRKNPTPAEKRFWLHARGKKISGLKFNRQFVIPYKLYSDFTRSFIADFYCHKLKLVIELDGRIHEYQKEYDNDRDLILNALGLKVIRFSNSEVFSNWPYVKNTIIALIV